MAIILEDIDMVSFPFKKQFTSFLREKFSDNGNVVDEFERSNYAYIKRAVQELEDQQFLKSFIQDKVGDLNNQRLKEFEMELLKEFGNSQFFLEGVYDETREMNNSISLDVVGVTARKCPRDGFEIYEDTAGKTDRWNKDNGVGLREILYRSTRIKYTVLEELDDEVVCMIEDNPLGLEGFLERGIPGILVRSHNVDESKVREMKKRFGDQFIVLDSHDALQRTVESLLC